MAEILTSIPYSAREKRGYWGQWFGTLKGREAIGIDRKANRLKKKKSLLDHVETMGHKVASDL